MNIVNTYASTISTIYSEVIKKYECDLEIIKQTEDELQDLMHEIELSVPKNAVQGYKLYKEIRELRIKRRTAKYEVELLKDMYEFFTSQNGVSFKNKIQNIQGNSRKLQAIQEARTYTPRQRNDLTIENKHSDESQNFEQMLAEFNKNKAYMKGGKMRK